MDVREESLGTTQHVPHPDRHQESSSTGCLAGTHCSRPEALDVAPGRGEGGVGNPEAQLGGVQGAAPCSGAPHCSRAEPCHESLRRDSQWGGGEDTAAGRGKPEPRRGPVPGKAMSSARPAPGPTGVHLRPTQQARRRVPTPGPRSGARAAPQP